MKNDYQQLMGILLEMKQDIGEMKGKLEILDDLKVTVDKDHSFIENLQGKIAVIAVFVGIGTSIISSWIRKNLGI